MFAIATIASAFTVFPGEAWVPMLTSKTDKVWVYAEEKSLQHGNLEKTINLGFYHRDSVGETVERHLTRFLCRDKQVHIIATGEFQDTTFKGLTQQSVGQYGSTLQGRLVLDSQGVENNSVFSQLFEKVCWESDL